MFFKRIILKKLDLGFNSDSGAPIPIVLSDEHKLYLLFFISNPNKNLDGISIHEKSVKTDKNVAIIHFKNFKSFKFGIPNDETIQGHPYYKYELKPYTNYVIENSEWIKELEKINSVHPLHKAEMFKDVKHFLFFFHDTNFECAAESYAIERINCSMKEAIRKVSAKLYYHSIIRNSEM